ncbi:MAG: CinA family protein [Nitrospirota bacterium]
MEQAILEVVGALHAHCKQRGLTLAVAESCTGGLVSHYITALPGASLFFKAGFVTYATEIKERVLGVPPVVLSAYGVVSEETAQAMAQRARVIARTEYALATTGNLGPDVLENKEKGLVYIAVCREGATLSRRLQLSGSRAEIKEKASLEALRFLVETIEQRI